MNKLIKLSDAAKLIDRTPFTVKRWYKWVEQIGEENSPAPLPDLIRIGKRGDRYILEEELPMLIEFRNQIAIQAGIMADFNQNRKKTKEAREIEEQREEMIKVFKNYLEDEE